MTYNIETREDAWAFIKRNRGKPIKLRINLTEEDGEDFEYANYETILLEGNSTDMAEMFKHYHEAMPPLVDIINLILHDIGSEDLCSDENIIEELMGNIDIGLSNMGYRGSELDAQEELLNDLARDMYNYIMYALVENRNVADDKVWEFLECKDAEIVEGKLYIQCQIYVEQLKDLDFMDERADVDFVEVVDELSKLLIATEDRNISRLVHSRHGNDRLFRGLVA